MPVAQIQDETNDSSWRPASAAEQIAATLRQQILRGDLLPGAPLDEARYAQMLGTSRNTIREAIRALARAGLVVPAHRRPATVTQLDEADVLDIFRVRRLVEIGAARLVTENDATDFTRLDRALEELSLVSGSRDWHRSADADLALHVEVVASAQSPRLIRMYDSVRSEIGLSLSLTDRWDSDPSDQLRQHEQIVQLLKSRDQSGCVDLLSSHLADAEGRVLAVLRRGQKKGAAQ